MENSGILYVFPVFHSAWLAKKIRCPAADDLFRVSLAQNAFWLTMELLSPCWSSSRERRQYNAVILSDCLIICSSIFIGQSANARLLWVIDSHTLLLVCQLHCFFRECVFPIKAAGKAINSMPLFKA